MHRDTPTNLDRRPIWWTCPVCRVEMSQIGVEIGPGTSRMSGSRPQTVPRTLLRHADHQIPLCVLCVSDGVSLFSNYLQHMQRTSEEAICPVGHGQAQAGVRCCGSLISRQDSHQARKRSKTSNFCVQKTSGGVGIFHVKGWRLKSLGCPETYKNNKTDFLVGYPGIFARISRSCVTIVQLKFVQLLAPKSGSVTSMVACREAWS